jgi:hypothetical protein
MRASQLKRKAAWTDSMALPDDRMRLPISSTLWTAVVEVMRARVPLARAILFPAAVVALSAVVLHFNSHGDRPDRLGRVGRIMLSQLVRLVLLLPTLSKIWLTDHLVI